MSATWTPQFARIRKIAILIQSAVGFTMGLYLYTWAPLFYESFLQVCSAQAAMTLTTFLTVLLNGLIVVLEVPTGAVGDALGRKWTVVWSLIFRMLFFVFLAFVQFFPSLPLILLFAMTSIVSFALSYTLFSGSFTAWCIDTLREQAPQMGYEQLLSGAYTYNFLLQIVGGVLGVFFYVHGLSYVGFLFAAVVCVAALAICLGEMENEQTIGYLDRSKLSVPLIAGRIGEIMGTSFQVFRRSPVILALVCLFASYMFVVNMIEYLWPVFLRSQFPKESQTFYWAGLVVVTLLACALGSHSLGVWTASLRNKRPLQNYNVSLRRWFIGTCLLSALPILALSWMTLQGPVRFWVFALSILPMEFAYGVIAPCFETLVNNYIPSQHADQRATILSFGSLARSFLVLLLAIPSGGSSGEHTAVGWAIPAVVLLLTTVVTHFVLKHAQRKASHEVAPERNQNPFSSLSPSPTPLQE